MTFQKSFRLKLLTVEGSMGYIHVVSLDMGGLNQVGF